VRHAILDLAICSKAAGHVCTQQALADRGNHHHPKHFLGALMVGERPEIKP
jgi:hypothetical protein